MRKYSLFVLVLLSAMFLQATKVVPMPDLKRPFFIEADDSQLYISDGPTVSIYFLQDFSLIRTCGRDGEGPGEFKVTNRNAGSVMISLIRDTLVVNSVNKVSFFTTSGEYLSERLTMNRGLRLQLIEPDGDAYVGDAFIREEKTGFTIRNLYDADFNRGKELYRRQTFFQGGKSNLNPFYSISPIVEVYGGKIFINGVDKDIYVFDAKGNKTNTITYNYEKLKVTDGYKKKIDQWYRTYPNMKHLYDRVKGRFGFPKYFPGIRLFNVADGKVYVLTFKKVGNKHEFVIFNIEGEFLDKVMVPFHERDIRMWSPYTIKNDTMYQLVDNAKKDTWELHITAIE